MDAVALLSVQARVSIVGVLFMAWGIYATGARQQRLCSFRPGLCASSAWSLETGDAGLKGPVGAWGPGSFIPCVPPHLHALACKDSAPQEGGP